MNVSVVWRWNRRFNDRRENVHDDEWSGWPSVVNDNMLWAVEGKITDNRRFTLTSHSLHFQKFVKLIMKLYPKN